MVKLDLKKVYKQLYTSPAKNPVLVEVPVFNYLMIDGEGDPNTAQEYKDALEALYGLAYTLKFAIKKKNPQNDYAVMPLEGLWWTPDMAEFTMDDKDAWHWTSMILQPDFVTSKDIDAAREAVEIKKNPIALPKIRFERFEEGLCVQIMHIGPYAAEAPTIKTLHDFICENNYKLRDKHHEIYLSDPRRTVPEKIKTLIRQPIEKE
ncbi:MAG: GyrI-like domain-containing protein [Candidatus Marinimicrobia bacterium]|nr:GyrI-like domain-containing protein [Candidatus Neomarinimicrobiota bacterium]